MVMAAEASAYLAMIREKVCSRCVERPAGGPPCGPLGKQCGIELHLPQLIDSIHEVRSRRIDPYLRNNQEKVCAHCTLLHSSCCPCPMESLAVLIVEAVEELDEKRQRRERVERLLAGIPTDDGSSAETVTDVSRHEEPEGEYTVFLRTLGDKPQLLERPVIRCLSHREARDFQRALRSFGYESIVRQSGSGAAGD